MAALMSAHLCCVLGTLLLTLMVPSFKSSLYSNFYGVNVLWTINVSLLILGVWNYGSYVWMYLERQKWILQNIVTPQQKNTFAGRFILAFSVLHRRVIIAWFCMYAYLTAFLLGTFTPLSPIKASFPEETEGRFTCACALSCLAVLYHTSIIVAHYKMCLNDYGIIENGFADMKTELNLIWNHSSDVLIIVTKKKSTAMEHLLSGRSVSKVTVHSSPSLFKLTGQLFLQNLVLSETFTDITKEAMSAGVQGRPTLSDSTPSGLEMCLRKAWETKGKDHFTYDFLLSGTGTTKPLQSGQPGQPLQPLQSSQDKECELVVSKICHDDGSITMIAVARDVSNRCKVYELEFEREKYLIARETAHTVKNLNTMAHHKVLEVLAELGTLPNENTLSAVQNTTITVSLDQLRQTLAIMMTAAQQSYQLSRIGEILSGKPQHLTVKVRECTKTWQKICGEKFCAQEDVLELLVDEFRLVAILSNAWSNALAHGDCTRMAETEIILKGNYTTETLEVSVINASQQDERPFDNIEDQDDVDELVEAQQERDGFGKSPAAKLTTQMGLSWMRKLCAGRLTLKSEGNGGKTTLQCVLDVDCSELMKSALAMYAGNRALRRRNDTRER